jgi:RHS repeat-associated protein
VAPDGDVACELKRTAWGDAEAASDATASTPLRLLGQYHDEETGLSYNRWRYYDAGQWLSPDPMLLSGGTNAYRFAPSTQNWMDPRGLAPDLDAMSRAELDQHMMDRAQRLHSRFPEGREQNGKTTAVGLVEGPNGRRLVYAVSSNRTCAGQRRSAARGGEERVTGPGGAPGGSGPNNDAEQILINNTQLGPGERLTTIAPSRPACGPERVDCQCACATANVRVLDPPH